MFVQVNRAPSFATDSKLDLHVKAGVIRDALRIINIQSVIHSSLEGFQLENGLDVMRFFFTISFLRPCNKKKKLVAHRMASRRRLIHTSTKYSRYNFLAVSEGGV